MGVYTPTTSTDVDRSFKVLEHSPETTPGFSTWEKGQVLKVIFDKDAYDKRVSDVKDAMVPMVAPKGPSLEDRMDPGEDGVPYYDRIRQRLLVLSGLESRQVMGNATYGYGQTVMLYAEGKGLFFAPLKAIFEGTFYKPKESTIYFSYQQFQPGEGAPTITAVVPFSFRPFQKCCLVDFHFTIFYQKYDRKEPLRDLIPLRKSAVRVYDDHMKEFKSNRDENDMKIAKRCASAFPWYQFNPRMFPDAAGDGAAGDGVRNGVDDDGEDQHGDGDDGDMAEEERGYRGSGDCGADSDGAVSGNDEGKAEED